MFHKSRTLGSCLNLHCFGHWISNRNGDLYLKIRRTRTLSLNKQFWIKWKRLAEMFCSIYGDANLPEWQRNTWDKLVPLTHNNGAINLLWFRLVGSLAEHWFLTKYCKKGLSLVSQKTQLEVINREWKNNSKLKFYIPNYFAHISGNLLFFDDAGLFQPFWNLLWVLRKKSIFLSLKKFELL